LRVSAVPLAYGSASVSAVPLAYMLSLRGNQQLVNFITQLYLNKVRGTIRKVQKNLSQQFSHQS